MSVSNKTKALLNLTGKKPADLSECLGKSIQSVRNKFSQDAFSVSDLLKIFDYLDCEMVVRTKDGQTITYNIDDVKVSERKAEPVASNSEPENE